MTLEEIENLPDISEYFGEDASALAQDRAPTVEDLMAADKRFAYTMGALQGQFDPKTEEEKKEDKEDGSLLAQTLLPFPCSCQLGVVVRNEARRGEAEGDVTKSILSIITHVTGVEVEGYKVSERLKGKFLSISVSCFVQTAAARQAAFDALAADARVKMTF